MSKLLVAGAREGGHLTVHLKHEIPHIELFSRVFACCDAGEVSAWVADEPTGQYARRAAFLYEFFTGQPLPVPSDLGGGYHDAISANGFVAASPGQARPCRTSAGASATACPIRAPSAR